MDLAKHEHRQYQQWAEEKTTKKTSNYKKAPIRKEMLPSWLNADDSIEQNNNGQKQTEDKTNLNSEQFEMEKKKLFDRIKNYKDNKNNE
jgi:replication initiation and membrane attachment protein